MMMISPLPTEIWKYILEIKSYQAWKERLAVLHLLIERCVIPDGKVLFIWRDGTNVVVWEFPFLLITVEVRERQIGIMRTLTIVRDKGVSKNLTDFKYRSLPSEYIP